MKNKTSSLLKRIKSAAIITSIITLIFWISGLNFTERSVTLAIWYALTLLTGEYIIINKEARKRELKRTRSDKRNIPKILKYWAICIPNVTFLFWLGGFNFNTRGFVAVFWAAWISMIICVGLFSKEFKNSMKMIK